jgi:hypothetical protein
MPELSAKQSATARNIRAMMLQQINDIGGNNIAIALGVNKSTISRMKEPGGKLDEYSEFLALLDLKANPSKAWVCSDDHIPLPISMVLKARTIVAGVIGEDSDFIKECDRGLRKLGILRVEKDGEHTIPMKYLK